MNAPSFRCTGRCTDNLEDRCYGAKRFWWRSHDWNFLQKIENGTHEFPRLAHLGLNFYGLGLLLLGNLRHLEYDMEDIVGMRFRTKRLAILTDVTLLNGP